MMWNSLIETIDEKRAHRYVIRRDETALSTREVFALWANDTSFQIYYTDLLAASPFPAYKWETPAASSATLNQDFEFILINTPALNRAPDSQAFADQFSSDKSGRGVILFPNLGGDAILVVPRPSADPTTYVHLASFLRNAPDHQKRELWSNIGSLMQSRVNARPIWLSTAGMGVAWLHIRLDSRPKYYGHQPYVRFPDSTSK